MAKYILNVGNIGNMEYNNKKIALDCYTTYVTLSKQNTGRAANENVTLMQGDNVIKEYFAPSQND